MADFGTTLSLLDSFDPLFPVVSSGALVIQRCYRRWTTNPDSEAGRRIWKGQCCDVGQILASKMQATTLDSWAQKMQSLALGDGEVDDCKVTFTGSRTLRTATMRAAIKVADQVFTLVMPLESLSAEVTLG